MNDSASVPNVLPASRSSSACAQTVEHFVTLFDDSFLPIGLTLYDSLLRHAPPFRLWVIAIDDAVAAHLRQLALPYLTIVPLEEIETPELLAVKPGRTRGEYCWTITPFVCQAVLERDPSAARATYVDADVFFLDDPRVLLEELTQSGKQVLITEHAFAPEYDRAHDSGRFCVQFLTFDRSPEARRVMTWWQKRCVEWCFARYEEGKFGDQVYLDRWPELFGNTVHIVQQVEKTLAPWNVRHFADRHLGHKHDWRPVMFHFHGLRLLDRYRARLYRDYEVGPEGDRIYDAYLAGLSKSFMTLRDVGIETPYHALPRERFALWHRLRRALARTERYGTIP